MLLSIAFVRAHVVLGPDVLTFGAVETLQVVEEFLVSTCLHHRKLMWVPELAENRLDIVLVHAEHLDVFLRAASAYESAESDIGVCRLLLLTVDTVCVELVVRDELSQLLSLILALLLFNFGVKPSVMH